MSNPKRRPVKFNSESEEQQFWASHDSTDYIDWRQARPEFFPNLKPTTQSISIRLPVFLVETIKQLAHKRDVPYQSLLKLILEEAVSKEVQKHY